MSYWSLGGEGCGVDESNSWVVLVEIWVVSSHEWVSKNEVWEICSEVASHNSHDTLWFSHLVYFQDVVAWGQSVVKTVNCPCEVGEGVEVAAIFLYINTLDHWVNDFIGSNNNWSTWVNNSFVSLGVGFSASLGNAVKLEWVVLLFNNIVESELVEWGNWLIKAWDGHVAGSWVGVENEWETLVRKSAGINVGWEVIYGNTSISKTNDSTHLWG